MAFWILAGAMTVAVAAILLLALLRAGTVRSGSDVQVYRDQLAEVERDLARGLIAQAEADQIRIEVSRRLLEADRAGRVEAEAPAPQTATLVVAGVVAASVVGGTLGLYQWLGAPGYPDLPLAGRIAAAESARLDRPAQAQAEAEAADAFPPVTPDPEYAAVMDQLRAVLAERPNDLQGHILLAQNEARLGDFVAAHRAQAQVIAIKGDEATAQDYADHADLLVLAAGGYVSPEAEAALREVLARDPVNGTARYYSGLLAAQTGRGDVAFGIWRDLLQASLPTDPWVPPIRAQLPGMALLAGVDYELPEASAMRGPSPDQIEAAGDLSPAERLAMIEGMVGGLSERLATEGGPPEDWARLIRAYGVLGRRDAAAAIWAEAQTVFPDDITRVPILRAARDAGVAQ